MTTRHLVRRSQVNPNAGKVRGVFRGPPEQKEFTIHGMLETFDLIGGNPDNGFATKEAATKLAKEWVAYPKDAHARIIKYRERWYVYGN